MKSVTAYLLVRDSNHFFFAEEIERLLQKGYALHGGPCMAYDGHNMVYAQAMLGTHTITEEGDE